MRYRLPTALLLVCILTAAASADVKLPALFTDHMVLQREMTVPVWGWATPGEAVSVRFGEQNVKTIAGADGKWSVKLSLLVTSNKPATLVVQGKNTITIQDVLVGEVWVGSGQSNMEFQLYATPDAAATIKAASPEVRLFISQGGLARLPATDIPHSPWWTSPGQVTYFSGVLYHFGRALHERLNVPIGVIESNVGGTPIQAWTPREAYETDPALKNELNWLHATDQIWDNAKAGMLQPYEDWLAAAKQNHAAGKPIPEPPAFPPDPILSNGGNPTVLYNAKIAPLIPYAIRGVVWYQGEANVGEGMHYAERLKAMIASWRKIWGEGDFPFGIVQIAPCIYGGNAVALPGIWEAEANVANTFPNCGLAVTNDLVTNIRDIHPPNKRPVGDRLALWAMATVYGKKNLEFSGPRYTSFAVEGDKIRIKFTHIGTGLALRDGKPLTWFTIAGADKKFVPATAVIDGDTVVVQSETVKQPVAVRFAWDQAAQPNLMNKEGLPAPAFRTDGP